MHLPAARSETVALVDAPLLLEPDSAQTVGLPVTANVTGWPEAPPIAEIGIGALPYACCDRPVIVIACLRRMTLTTNDSLSEPPIGSLTQTVP